MLPNPIHSTSTDGTANRSKTGQPNNEKENTAPFRSLAPISDADQSGNYCSALLWAIENRDKNDIKNIALTGPYGSGKSSILKTFVAQAKQKRKELHFLNISLATFKEEYELPVNDLKKSPNPTGPKSKDEVEIQLLRQIEYSILQQIFYHVHHNDIPHTRFRKQRSLSEEKARKWTSGIFLFLLALIFELYHQQLWSILGITPHRMLLIYYHAIAWLFLGICTYNFIKHSINSLHTIRLRKFSIKSAEFGVDNTFEKSILNEHLDEILYFFDVTPYNVVIIEDLDRFNRPEIYTKLREINQLINNKADRKSVVSFIYAVKDDIFLDRNRTKFFDFIIPVIPVVSPTNSNDILRRLVNENKYLIDPDLLDGIASYVDDMRLLYNIMNEFYIYKNTLNERLDQNKLLALILYKNAYPSDFVALSNREGLLYNALNEKDRLIGDQITGIDEQIQFLKVKKEELETANFISARELRKLYVLEALTSKFKIVGFTYHEGDIGQSELLEEHGFELLKTGNILGKYQLEEDLEPVAMPIEFKEIEKRVDGSLSYEQRLHQLNEIAGGKIEMVKKEIEVLEQNKRKIRTGSIRSMLENKTIDLSSMEHKQEQLVSILLRSGYIDEYFESYISIFYSESITRADADFLLNVQAHIRTDFNYSLTHRQALLNKIKEVEFDREYVLNYQLIDHLLSKKASPNIRTKIFTTLSKETDISLEFIDGYIKRGKNISQFIAALAKCWPNMWWYYQTAQRLSAHRALDDQKMEEHLLLIIQHANVADIKNMEKVSGIREYISRSKDFLTISAKGRKLEELISGLEIKFKDLDFNTAPHHLLNYVFSWNFYEINVNMLRKWSNFHDGSISEEIETSNYTALNNSMHLDPMLEYIDNNLKTYIENVWLNLKVTQRESSEVLEKFLMSGQLSQILKMAIIDKCETKIPNLADIEDVELAEALLKHNRVMADWPNLISYFEKNGGHFDDAIVEFLNVNSNMVELQGETLHAASNIKQDVVRKFGEALILCNELSTRNYGVLIECIPARFAGGLKFETLSIEKVNYLLNKLELSVENFHILNSKYPSLSTKLFKENIDNFIDEIDDYKIYISDLLAIFNDNEVPYENKRNLMEIVISDRQIDNLQDLFALTEIALQQDLPLPANKLDRIMRSQRIPLRYRIKLAYDFFEKLRLHQIKTILTHWEEPYRKLGSDFDEIIFSSSEIDYRFLKFLLKKDLFKKIKKTSSKVTVSNLID